MYPGAIRLGLFLLDMHAIQEGLAAAWTLRCCGLRRKHPLAECAHPAVELLADLGGRERRCGLRLAHTLRQPVEVLVELGLGLARPGGLPWLVAP
jgi:hypothetical protein